MTSSRLFLAACFLGFSWAPSASAIFDVQAMLGQRSGTWVHSESSGNVEKDISASEMRVGLHIDPVPLVPVSFGLGLEKDTYKSTTDHGFSKLEGLSVQPEVTVWLPLGDLAPYARVGYAFNAVKGTLAVTTTQPEAKSVVLRGAGTHLGLGLKYSLIPTLALLVEYSMGFERVKPVDEITSGTKPPEFDFKTTGFLAGIQWGL